MAGLTVSVRVGLVIRRWQFQGINQPECYARTLSSTPTKKSGADAYLALAAVSLFWGTTYLAIRISLEAFPPFYLIAIRYTISGLLMLLGAVVFGAHIPRGRELWQTVVTGIVTIGVGNGCLAYAEQWVPSGLAALFITTSPFWMVGVDAILPQGKQPRASTLGGLLVGIGGVGYLILPTAIHEGLGSRTLVGFFILQLGTAGWITGALLQRRVAAKAHSFVTGAIQQLATGIAMCIPSVLFEKAPTTIPVRPGLAVLYLVLFGSTIGYSSFVYAMARLPVAVVSIYTYLNPIVAVSLGWLFYREPFGIRELIAMLIIFAGVALVKWSESNQPSGGGVPSTGEQERAKNSAQTGEQGQYEEDRDQRHQQIH